MPFRLENFGLESLTEDEESFYNMFAYLVENGKAIQGYSRCPSLFNLLGKIDFYVTTKRKEDGQLEAVDLDTHCSGRCVWEIRNIGIDLTPEDATAMNKAFIFCNNSTGKGMVPIHLINADVLPSFLEGDVVKAQMCALPVYIEYFSDNNEYEEKMPRADDGKQYLIADGTFFPTNFLYNHDPKNPHDKDFSTDDLVMFHATVKSLYHGPFKLGSVEEDTFIRCIADTQFGEIEFIHSIDQISEEQRKNIKIGSVIAGTCILSGDVAIYEYEKGYIKDYEHDLRAVRQVLEKGNAERIRSILAQDACYDSVASKQPMIGPDSIITRFNKISNEVKGEITTYLAAISSADDQSHSCPVGTRCLVLCYDSDDVYDSLLFLELNEANDITRIVTTDDKSYRFKIDGTTTEQQLS